MSAERPRQLIVEADGGSRGNPGPSGFGALVRERDGAILAEAGEKCGLTTNNVAEYSGLLAGLQMAAAIDPGAVVEVRMDSKLVVEQMSGRWKIKDRRLAGIAAKAFKAFDADRVRYTWVPRAQNAAADRLANDAMDGNERPVQDALGGPSTRGDHAPPPDKPSPSDHARLPLGARQPDLGEATTVLLVRHGRTHLTQARRFSGVGGEDAALSDQGRVDALTAAAFLADVEPDAVVTSPLLRARQTAELLGGRLNWPGPAVDERWAEVGFGDWDGLSAAEITQHDPDLFGQWLSRADVRPPGGESMLELEDRVSEALEDLLVQHRGGTVVVFCHMTPIRSVVRRVLGAGEQALWRLRVSPGSLTTTRFWPDDGAEVDGIGLHVPADAPEVLF